MTVASQRFRLLAGVAVILLLGFAGTSLSSYWVGRDTVRVRIAGHGLPLTSDTVYSEVQRDLLRPVGMGLTLDLLGQQINELADRYQRRIYFVTPEGRIVLYSRNVSFADQPFRDVEGLGQYWDAISTRRDGEVLRGEYSNGQGTALVNARFIPELGWTLVVEEDEEANLGSLRRVLIFNLGLSAAATLLVLWLLALMIQRHQRKLEQMATSDALTGVLNRQGFDLIMVQALREHRRNRGALSGMLFDIDWFKQINDSHGHLKGDSVLVAVTKLAQQSLRGNDVLVRWGGEEFFVLLKDCDEAQARHMAQRLCQAVEAHDFGIQRKVTLSIGVTQFIEGQSEDVFFSRADAALYRAKRGGRNRVMHASLLDRGDKSG